MKKLTDSDLLKVASLPHPSAESRKAFTMLLLACKSNPFEYLSMDVVDAVKSLLDSPRLENVLRHGDSSEIITEIGKHAIQSATQSIHIVENAIKEKFSAVAFLKEFYYATHSLTQPGRWEIYNDGIAVLMDTQGTPIYKVTLGNRIDKMVGKLNLMKLLADTPVAFLDGRCPWDIVEKTVVRKMSDKNIAFCMPTAIHLSDPNSINRIDQASKYLKQVLWQEGHSLVPYSPDNQYHFIIELVPGNINSVFYYENNATSSKFGSLLAEIGYEKLTLQAKKKSEPYCCVVFAFDGADETRAQDQIRQAAIQAGKAIAEVIK